MFFTDNNVMNADQDYILNSTSMNGIQSASELAMVQQQQQQLKQKKGDEC